MKSIKTIILSCTVLSTGLIAAAQHKEMNKVNLKSIVPLDTAAIERIMGIKGRSNKGEYKITVPQNDLNIMVDGFKIIPAMGLGTWIAFTPAKEGTMIMGDIVLTETDLKPVQQEVIRQGLSITAIHNHFVRNHPNVMYMHGAMVKKLSQREPACWQFLTT